MELSKQETDLFFHFQASDQKSSFTKCFSFIPRGSRLIFQTGNGIIQTRNGIIHPTSWLLMKKNSFTKFYSIDLSGPTLIFKTGYMELSKQEMEIFPHAFGQRTSFTICYSIDLMGSKLIFKTGIGTIQT